MAKKSLDSVGCTFKTPTNNRMNERIRVTSATLSLNLLWLKKWNVVIVDWLKYRFNWKDALVIDKNAKKSAEIQWKEYKTIISLHKLNLLKWKSYAPYYPHDVVSLDKMPKDEIDRRVALATKLYSEYNIETSNFYGFDGLWQITRTEELWVKLKLLKWKSYAPHYLHDVVSLDKMPKDEIDRRVALATKLYSEYNIETSNFYGFDGLWQITRTEELWEKLKLLKWKSYAPYYPHDAVSLDKMPKDEIDRRVASARRGSNFHEFSH